MEGLAYGDFVRVRKEADFRPGQDGMVVSPPDADGNLGMVFHYDRYGEAIRSRSVLGSYHTPCEGIEAWHVDELDLASRDR